ncbi:tricarboxylic transporter [Rothia nasimurium]|uniref:Tricarboxylic transporter n=1 Tax=Rothia nasimurium TaxID=85336 RepID=A0A1Y1RS19_9MICC|nr:tripartite tricarboxylate transporter substrate-binding protein [Rothia nasimurium]ORC24394.1 tricarboxylic transporter [Rothia nasimurium]
MKPTHTPHDTVSPATQGIRISKPQSTALRLLGALLAAASIGTASLASYLSADEGTDLSSNLTIIAPAAAGGGWDTVAREMQQAQRANGIVNNTQVVNMPGAGGTIALSNLGAMAGDPTTLMVGGTGQLAATIQFDTDTTYEDVTPLAVTVEELDVIVVPADSPYQSLDELMAAWKADPGSVPWTGGGSFDRLVATEMAMAAEIPVSEMIYVNSDGGGEATAALLNGTVAASASGYPDSIDQIESGRLRALAVVAPERIEGVDIPTTVEQGYDVTMSNWRLIVAPGDISPEEKAALEDIVRQTVETPEWDAAIERYNWNENLVMGDELTAFLTEERDRIEKVYEELGL